MDISENKQAVRLLSSHSSAFVMRHIPYMVLASFILLMVLFRPFSDFVGDTYITSGWAVLVFCILLASLITYWININNQQQDEALSLYLIRMLHVNAIAFACVWSVMLNISYLNAAREYQLLIIILASGISAGAFPILVVFNYIYLIFVSIMLLPLIVAQLMFEGANMVAGLMAVLWIILITASNRMGASIRALMYLQEVNIDLVHRLADTNVNLEQFNKELLEENAYRLKSTQMFREKSQFLERIMDATSDGIMVFDKQGMIVSMNARVSSICGYSQEKLLGRHYTDNIFPDSDPGLMGMVHNAYTHFKSSMHEPCWILSRQGELKELKVSVSVLESHSELSTVVCTLVDYTKEKELETIKDEFVSNVSHELRTPLTSIHGSLRLLEAGVKDSISTKMQEMLSIAMNNSRRLLGLIDELLELKNLDANGVVYNSEVCNACEVLREAVGATQGYAAIHHVELQLKSCLDVSINVDRNRFIQVLFNLISNAIKFTPAEKTVWVDMYLHGTLLRLEVLDQGEGIAEAFRPYLFDRYKQERSTARQRQNSSGLGLNIAKQMLESMGGHIAYKTDMGQGTAFYIDIPIANITNEQQE